MGYKKDIDYRGMKIEKAYHRIDTTASSNGSCEATLNVYVTRDAFIDGESYLEQRIVTYPIKYGVCVGSDRDQGYFYLLQLDENKDAVPVFEE